jgi:hypothetical protein
MQIEFNTGNTMKLEAVQPKGGVAYVTSASQLEWSCDDINRWPDLVRDGFTGKSMFMRSDYLYDEDDECVTGTRYEHVRSRDFVNVYIL